MQELFLETVDYLANSAVLFSLIICVTTLVIFALLTVVQLIEWWNKKDFLKPYRGIILTFLIVSFLALIPVTYLLTLRTAGIESEHVRNLATVSGRLGGLAQALAFVFIFFYRRKEK